MSKAVIFFAPGLEECEGLLCVDLLRRSGVEVTIAAVGAFDVAFGQLRDDNITLFDFTIDDFIYLVHLASSSNILIITHLNIMQTLSSKMSLS